MQGFPKIIDVVGATMAFVKSKKKYIQSENRISFRLIFPISVTKRDSVD